MLPLSPKSCLGLLVVLSLMTSCKESSKSETETATEVPSGDTSENALDWNGQYKGTLPCDDCSGIATTLTLRSDGDFRRVEFYKDKSQQAIVERGSFSWDDSGSIIILAFEDGSTQGYKVGENQLWHLDENLQQRSDSLADQYILYKNRMDLALENKKWVLKELMGQTVELQEGQKEAYLIFNSENAMVSGNNGCNQISMGYELLEGNRFKLAPGITTLMACPYENISDQLNEVLDRADNYTISDGELHLNKARMAPLAKFKLVPETP